MNWLVWVVQWLWACTIGGCFHRHYTWPHHNPAGFDYVCCLDCGAELPYSEREMRIMRRKEVLQQRSQLAREQVGFIRPGPVLVFSRKDSTAPRALAARVGDIA